MKVLIACEYSGTVRDAFIKRGHDAISCDLLPTDKPGPHLQGDVSFMLDKDWDLIIAHPPCTYMSNSGVRWLVKDGKPYNPNRWIQLKSAVYFFNLFAEHTCSKIAIENPIPHKYAALPFETMIIEGERIPFQQKGIGKHTQTIQPYGFGHLESKRTCLWLKGLPTLKETNNVYDEMMQLTYAERNKVHHCPPGPDRWKIRSTTYQGIADAMAEQWG